MTIEIEPYLLKELQYIIELHREHGAAAEMESVESLVGYVLICIADGSRRPLSWERQLLEMMGLVAESDDHQDYREHYGK